MRVELLAVGKKMPAWVQDGVAQYAKRMRSGAVQWQLTEVEAERRRAGLSAEQCRQREAERILARIDERRHVCLLDERGKPWSTVQLSQQLSQWMQAGDPLTLIAGGPDGVDDRVRARANSCWSLSALTLPHPLVRVVVAEQLYRANSLLQGHPYHRE